MLLPTVLFSILLSSLAHGSHISLYCNGPGYHAHPTSCSLFVQCDENGKAFVKECAPGTLWDTRLDGEGNKCNHKSAVDCQIHEPEYPEYPEDGAYPPIDWRSHERSEESASDDKITCSQLWAAKEYLNGWAAEWDDSPRDSKWSAEKSWSRSSSKSRSHSHSRSSSKSHSRSSSVSKSSESYDTRYAIVYCQHGRVNSRDHRLSTVEVKCGEETDWMWETLDEGAFCWDDHEHIEHVDGDCDSLSTASAVVSGGGAEWTTNQYYDRLALVYCPVGFVNSFDNSLATVAVFCSKWTTYKWEAVVESSRCVPREKKWPTNHCTVADALHLVHHSTGVKFLTNDHLNSVLYARVYCSEHSAEEYITLTCHYKNHEYVWVGHEVAQCHAHVQEDVVCSLTGFEATFPCVEEPYIDGGLLALGAEVETVCTRGDHHRVAVVSCRMDDATGVAFLQVSQPGDCCH